MFTSKILLVHDGRFVNIALWSLLLLIAWTYLNAFTLWRRRPSGIKITGSSLFLGKWISTIKFDFKGITEIQKAYKKCPSQELFAVPALRQYQVLVSNPQQVREMAATRTDVLSFNAAFTDRLFEKQIMYGFQFGDPDPNNDVAKRAIKFTLSTHLPELAPKIRSWVANGVESQLKFAPIDWSDISRTVNLTSFVRAAVMHVNSQVLFGDELASDPAFQKAALRYSMDGAFTAEFCRQLPAFIAPALGRAAMAWSGAMRAVGARVTELIDQRVIAESEGKTEHFLDITQKVIQSSRSPRLRTRARLAQQIMALLFAMSHQTPLSVLWAITMLSTHREYIQLLREEIEKVECDSKDRHLPLGKLRLMDSFLRETSRMHPIDGLGVNRKAMKNFSFSDGSHVPAGNLLAVPQHALMRDERIYKEPNRFDGHRFYTPESNVASNACTKHTDTRWDFPYWGAPSHACPGRWYASDLNKQFLVYILKNYDFEILNSKNATTPRIWTTELIPRSDTQIKFRRRCEDSSMQPVEEMDSSMV